MTTKVRIDGVTIETTGELERELMERTLQYLASRHRGTVVTPLSPEETEVMREMLKEDSGSKVSSEKRDIDSVIKGFDRWNADTDKRLKRIIGRPHTYPRLNATGEKVEGPRTGASIGEMLAASGRIPENWTRRKAQYWCPVCGHEGTRHIYSDWAFLRCSNCDARLKVEPATADGNPDKRGNYFVARELFNVNASAAETNGEPDSGTPDETANGAVKEAQVDG